MALHISNDIYNRILTCIGYPIIQVSDLGVQDDDIKELMILPVLKDLYFKWFPIPLRQQIQIGTTFNIPFPNDNVYAVMDARLNTRYYTAGMKTANPLINDLNINISSTNIGQGKYGTRNNYGFTLLAIAKEEERQSYVDMNKAVKYTVDYPNRILNGYTNIQGDLSVTWAQFSEDVDDVLWGRREEFIQLCQAYILRFFGQLSARDDSGIPSSLNADSFIDRASEIEEKVMDIWRSISKVSLIRN